MSDPKKDSLARVPTTAMRPLEFSAEQKQMIRDSYANGATNEEFSVLMEIARTRNLNPLLKQVYFVKRWDKSKGREVWSAQVSIDGLRAIAQRTGQYDGQDQPEFEYADNGKGKLKSCKIKVYRKDWSRPAVGFVMWDEAAQTNKSGELTDFWRRMPHRMIEKVAESIALRKAFSEETGGISVEGVEADDSEPDIEAVFTSARPAPAPAPVAAPPAPERPVAPAPTAPVDAEFEEEPQAPPRATPSGPPDMPLPFTSGPFAGKKLSDLKTEDVIRTFVAGFRRVADEAADAGDAALQAEKLKWADRVIAWAKYRNINVE